MDTRFETERLVLRTLVPEDAETLHARITGDAEVMRVSPSGLPVDLERTRKSIERFRAHEHDHGYSIWAVEEKATGELVGYCGLFLVEGKGPDTEVVYRLMRDRWGRGYATEAAKACIERGFTLGLRRIVALTSPDHVASRRVMEKCGMTYAGTGSEYGMDLVRYAIEHDPDLDRDDGW